MTGRADRAKSVLESEEFQQAFKDVKDALSRSFFETAPDNEEKLIDLRKYAELLDAVKANLEQAVADGELEDFEANQPKETI